MVPNENNVVFVTTFIYNRIVICLLYAHKLSLNFFDFSDFICLIESVLETRNQHNNRKHWQKILATNFVLISLAGADIDMKTVAFPKDVLIPYTLIRNRREVHLRTFNRYVVPWCVNKIFTAKMYKIPLYAMQLLPTRSTDSITSR